MNIINNFLTRIYFMLFLRQNGIFQMVQVKFPCKLNAQIVVNALPLYSHLKSEVQLLWWCYHNFVCFIPLPAGYVVSHHSTATMGWPSHQAWSAESAMVSTSSQTRVEPGVGQRKGVDQEAAQNWSVRETEHHRVHEPLMGQSK